MRQLIRSTVTCSLVLLLCGAASGQCDPGNGLGGSGADVIVGDLHGSIQNYGNAGGYYAYSIGTTSCNIGTAELLWIAGNTQHPVIGQNMYRLKDGRFEHIGQSWLKHGFTALQQNACGCGCQSSGTGNRLGLGCSDPYSSGLNGGQNNAGAKSEVTDPANGLFIYPQILDPANQDLTWRRLRVAADDMNPTLNAGALYFVEGHYVSPDDAAAGNQDNNASYRGVNVGSSATNFPLSYNAATQRQKEGIQAWKDTDPSVTLVEIDTPDNGLMILGYNVTDNGNGTFHYEYALYNMNSTRGAGSFSLPLAGGITLSNVGFHDVEYHSGEPYDGTDWAPTIGGAAITWATDSHASNPNANAIRWGTLYNFRFDAPAMPVAADATIGFFLPGTPTEITAPVLVPSGDFTNPVTNLACSASGQNAALSWTNGDSYSSIEITKDGSLLTTLGGGATSYTDFGAGVGPHMYEVTGIVGTTSSGPISCLVEIEPPLAISFPNGLPGVMNPFGGTVDVEITEQNGGVLLANSPTMFLDTGSGLAPVSLTSLGGDLYEATFSASTCGDVLSLYFSAETTAGTVVTDPSDAPTGLHTIVSASNLSFSLDDAETDTGWTAGLATDSATTGEWVLGNPNGSDAQPEDDHTPDPADSCWFTGQAPVGDLGGNDVDGGSTTLVSPPFALAGFSSATIGYWRWYSNDAGASPNADTLVVQVSDDGTQWSLVEMVGPTGIEASGGWFFSSFEVESLVNLTDSVQVRFIASDLGGGSIVEAAIDDLELLGYVCDLDCNNNGTPDDADISSGTSQDCNQNEVPDECDISSGFSLDGNTNGIPDECESSEFVRGDCNGDGSLDISDVIRQLGVLFNGEGPTGCSDSCDGNDDGAFDLSDVTTLLNSIFGLGSTPSAPYPACGSDPTGDGIDCGSFNACP